MARAEDDQELIRRHRAGDQRARETFIERYLPLARSLALRYRFAAEPLDDLIQVASIGLFKAVDRWDPERGLAFSTYAVPTILGEIRRYFRDSTWLVRPPRELTEIARSIDRVRGTLDTTIGREATVLDLAERLGRSPETIAEAQRAADCRWVRSLDTVAVDESSDSATLGELIGGEDVELEQVEARASFELMTSSLDRRAQEILRLRFADDMLQSEIADRVGCSQVHVSRIVRSSLEKLAA
jgi:RNA polymerase sigma-B factor